MLATAVKKNTVRFVVVMSGGQVGKMLASALPSAGTAAKPFPRPALQLRRPYARLRACALLARSVSERFCDGGMVGEWMCRVLCVCGAWSARAADQTDGAKGVLSTGVCYREGRFTPNLFSGRLASGFGVPSSYVMPLDLLGLAAGQSHHTPDSPEGGRM